MRSSDLRRAYLYAHPMEFSIAVCTLLLGILFVLSPGTLQETAIGRALPEAIEQIWNAALLIGGALVLYGMLRLQEAQEVGGLILIATTLLMDAIALVDGRGLAGATITGGVLVAAAVGHVARAWVIIRAAEIRNRA